VTDALAHPGPALVDLVTDPDAFSIPPHVTATQVKGFALASGKIVLDGGVGKMLARGLHRRLARGDEGRIDRAGGGADEGYWQVADGPDQLPVPAQQELPSLPRPRRGRRLERLLGPGHAAGGAPGDASEHRWKARTEQRPESTSSAKANTIDPGRACERRRATPCRPGTAAINPAASTISTPSVTTCITSP
jgi:hypothetical protein